MKIFSTIIGCLLATALIGQTNHWEMIVQEDHTWSYFLGSLSPPSTWAELDFDDNAWSEGQGGFGYGDNDDNTFISNTRALYIRHSFTIFDITKVEQAILDIDYDDSFVAYINGVEIARANISGTPPSFMTFADNEHEAQMYQGGLPDRFILSNDEISGLLNQGNNMLAIQVHNVTSNSSDMSVRPFLFLGINDASFSYIQPPNWFIPPFIFESSKLPIIVVETNGQSIVNDPPVLSSFGIIYNGEGATNNIADPLNEYDGFGMIEFRGESSLSFAKKSYALETCDASGVDKDAAFLNFPEEEDWVLYGPYSDKTLLRNVMTMDIGHQMGRYHSRTRLCELVVNGAYKGVYVMMEKLKRDKNRLDIAKLKTTDIEGEELTGGYLFRIDKGTYPGWNSNYTSEANPWAPIRFQYRYPDPDSIQPEQEAYIQSYVHGFEDAIANSPTFINNAGLHYTDYIDLESFVDNFIINELSRNVDGYRLSTYFHKDKNSKMVAGPFWDFNLGFGNADYCDGSSTSGWIYDVHCGANPFWWGNMRTDPTFLEALKCRWSELRETALDTDNLLGFIDSMALILEQPAQRNFTKWPTLNSYVWPNPGPFTGTYSGEVGLMKTWLQNRLAWMDMAINPIDADCSETVSTSDPELNAIGQLKLQPNPNYGIFEVEFDSALLANKEAKIQVMDIAGRIIFEQTVTPETNQLRFNLDQNVSAGVFIVQLSQQNRTLRRTKMILY
jgi:hypothetical protein